MKQTINLTENQLRAIIKEEISKYLNEGIDIITNDQDKRIVTVNNSHQNFVDTNNYKEPYIFSDQLRGYKTLSIFQRKNTEDKLDSNPLLNALKGRRRWELGDKKNDLMKLLRNFVSASHLLPKYDTIIMTPSNNELNKTVFGYLIRLIQHDYAFENFFEKLSANDVYENMIDEEFIETNFQNPAKVYNDIDYAFGLMNKNNNGIFSYKCLQVAKYRDAIIQSMKVNMSPSSDLNYADSINNKDVLVFDDTITTGKTISDSGNAIKEMFSPKSITFVTLFSAIDNETGFQKKETSL